jgi:hypothetical protein
VVVDLPAGIYRVFVRTEHGTAGPYRVDLRLPGAVAGQRIVDEHAVQLAEAAMLKRHFGFNSAAQELFGQKLGIDLSVDQFRFEFDANLNGHIDAMDMNAILTNYANGSAAESLATWTLHTSGAGGGASGEAESHAEFKLSDVSFSVFQNPEQPTDVNADRQLTPLDALLVVKALNAIGSTSIDVLAGQDAAGEGETSTTIAPPFVDVNGDYQITPLDALLVVNALNSADSVDGNMGAEGEAAAFAGADTERPLVAEVSRWGDHEIAKVEPFGSRSTNVFGAGVPTPPDSPMVGLSTSPTHRSSCREAVRGQETYAQPETEPHRAERDGYNCSPSAEPPKMDSDLLDLLAEDVSSVWN